MRFFKGKPAQQSGLRFCEHASELPTSSLFGNGGLHVEIVKVGHDIGTGFSTDCAHAYGVVHNYNYLAAVLPVMVTFNFDQKEDCSLIEGSISKMKCGQSSECYYAEIFISDPNRAIFDSFISSFEHAVISGLPSTILSFSKRAHRSARKRTSKPEGYEQERYELDDMMAKVERGSERMPELMFHEITFSDVLTCRAPSWMHAWSDFCADGPEYYSEDVASWRALRSKRI